MFEKVARWFDKHLGWHSPSTGVGSFDGCSFHSKCKYCDKSIMQDSNGDWF